MFVAEARSEFMNSSALDSGIKRFIFLEVSVIQLSRAGEMAEWLKAAVC